MAIKIITQAQKQEGYCILVNGVVIQLAYPNGSLSWRPDGNWNLDLDKLDKGPPPGDRLPLVDAR